MSDGGSVLLVEDDGLLAGIIERYLGAHGHPVRVVGSAEEAGRALGEERPALVLLDINLPGDTGWSFLRTPVMSAHDAPPVVVVSAGTVTARRLRESGAAGYLAKPFPLETLLATVHRVTAADTGRAR
jgi:DNA-binding response OmpR family regulator